MYTANVTDVLDSGRFVILSAEPNRFDDLVTTALRWSQMMAAIDIPILATGRYEGVAERSLIIPGGDIQTGTLLGDAYEQESVLVGNVGLVYRDGGRVVPFTGENTIEVGSEGSSYQFNDFDNATMVRCENGYVLFSLGLDFES